MDPIDQHFGLERSENAGTFRIVGVVRDARFARFGPHQPARPTFFVPLAQPVDYHTDYRRMIEDRSHFIQGILLLTSAPPGDLEPLLRRTLASADPDLTITSVRTIGQNPFKRRPFVRNNMMRDSAAAARWMASAGATLCWPRMGA
ncbi:MAG TPA: hypothetical protein VML19_18340 [Verrucomicrobiae bacterium]|nr:hypothetical protein [Verrucomicrobiae bacterium]